MRTYSQLSYDAVAVSPQDLNAGREFFKTSQVIKFPWISANVIDDDGQLVFPPSIVIKRTGATDVGVIGLTGASENNPIWAQVGDWRKLLPEHIRQLKTTCGMLILLSNLSDDDNREIAQNYPQIDIIVVSSPTIHGNQVPLITGDSLITQSDGKGKYLGKIELKWHPEGSWHATSQTDTHKRLQEQIVSIDRQVKLLQESSRETHQEYSGEISKLLNRRKSIENQLNLLETTLAEQKTVIANTFDATFLPVKPRSSGDEVDNIVQDLKKSVSAYQKNRLRQNGHIDQNAGEVLQLSHYAGVDSCKSCHEKQSAFWSTTAHAKAFTTLVKTGQNYNSECLPCHVTGGNISPVSSNATKDLLLKLPEDRQVVGCETCHGPGKKHSLNPGNVKPTRKPTEENCTSCHTPEHDDNFDYSAKRKKAGCPLNM